MVFLYISHPAACPVSSAHFTNKNWFYSHPPTFSFAKLPFYDILNFSLWCIISCLRRLDGLLLEVLLGTPQGASPASPSATELTMVLRTCTSRSMRKIQNAAVTMLRSFPCRAALSLTIPVVRSGRRTRIRAVRALQRPHPNPCFSALKPRDAWLRGKQGLRLMRDVSFNRKRGLKTRRGKKTY